MPLNKSAFLRYRVIDACLTNPMRRYPDMQYILDKIAEQTGAEISVSMFNKDIQNMKSIYKAPIKFDRTHMGYCYTEEDFSIREFPLNHEEIEALDVSTALLGQLKGSKIFQHFENAINKVIEGYRVSKILGKAESDILQTEEPVQSTDGQWLETLLRAIIEKKVLLVRYEAFGREAKDHVFSPYLCKEYRNRWYVVGWSERVENVLVFSLDRIKEIRPSKKKYYSLPGFDGKEFFKYSMGITQVHGQEPEEVVLSFTPAQAHYVKTQPLHHSQEILKDDEKEVLVRLKLCVTQELIMAVLSYGTGVRVVEPASLRNKIRDTLTEMGKLYKGNEQ
jgi:predicted DNA-binding transcriptional regulator YafY